MTLFSLFKRTTSQAGLTAVGIHADGVSFARVDRSGDGRPHLSLCEYQPFNGDEPAKVLARAAAHHHLKKARCTTVLDDPDYQLLITEAPDVKADELKAAIRWRIKDLINFHINDATLDVFDLPGESTPGRLREMYVVAAQNEAIQRRVDLMDKSGVGLEVIDIPELAQRNLAALLPEDEAGVALLSFSHAGGLITLTRRGQLYLSRGLNVGLDLLLHTQDRYGLFDQIVLEVQRSMDYFESHFREAPIRHVMIAPTPEEIPGLVEHLAANLNARCAQADFAAMLDCDQALPAPLQAMCLGTIGAALRQEVKAL